MGKDGGLINELKDVQSKHYPEVKNVEDSKKSGTPTVQNV
jgi:hypothetical protein